MSSSLNNARECLLSPVVFSSLSLLRRMSSSWNNACECLLSLVVFSSLLLPLRMSSSLKQCLCFLWGPVVFSTLLLLHGMPSSPKQCLWIFVGSWSVFHGSALCFWLWHGLISWLAIWCVELTCWWPGWLPLGRWVGFSHLSNSQGSGQSCITPITALVKCFKPCGQILRKASQSCDLC